MGSILSTAVPDSQASRVLSRIVESDLSDPLALADRDGNDLEDQFESLLRGSPAEPSYRFPRQRARQLAAIAGRLYCRGTDITGHLEVGAPPIVLRRHMVSELCVGPKQASLFLRNSGFTSQVAIFDRHVWRYMIAAGLASDCIPPSRIGPYEEAESAFLYQAATLGVALAAFDRALWVVYRAMPSHYE
jgi:N-glycosylase/DNA lyase